MQLNRIQKKQLAEAFNNIVDVEQCPFNSDVLSICALGKKQEVIDKVNEIIKNKYTFDVIQDDKLPKFILLRNFKKIKRKTKK